MPLDAAQQGLFGDDADDFAVFFDGNRMHGVDRDIDQLIQIGLDGALGYSPAAEASAGSIIRRAVMRCSFEMPATKSAT